MTSGDAIAAAIAPGSSARRFCRHFPTEQALFDACTSHYYARHPMPGPNQWAAIAGPDERIRIALTELYAWYDKTEEMLTTGIRDIDHVPGGARESFFAYFEAAHASLMAGRRERGRARARVSGAIGHAISFPTWRPLVREQQLKPEEAVSLMTRMVDAALVKS